MKPILNKISDSIHLLSFTAETETSVLAHVLTLKTRRKSLLNKKTVLQDQLSLIDLATHIVNWPVPIPRIDTESTLKYMQTPLSKIKRKQTDCLVEGSNLFNTSRASNQGKQL
jgi:hypothetical protein